MKQYRLAIVLAIFVSLAVCGFAYAGKGRLTTHAEMMTRLSSLEASDASSGNGRIHVVSIGSSVNGKAILLVAICDPSTPPDNLKKLFVICRQHGNEPASTEGMLNLIEELVTSKDEQTGDLLKKVEFMIVPMANPDGADSFERRNANGADLNRDWISLTQPETKAVWAAIETAVPDVLIDEHELSPGNRKTDFIETAGITSGASEKVVAESAQLQDLVIGMLRTHDMSVRSCRIEDKCPARLAHRYFPICEGTKTLLFETKQAGARQSELSVRMKLHIVGTMTVAKFLAGQGEEMWQQIVSNDRRQMVQLASRKGKRSGRR